LALRRLRARARAAARAVRGQPHPDPAGSSPARRYATRAAAQVFLALHRHGVHGGRHARNPGPVRRGRRPAPRSHLRAGPARASVAVTALPPPGRPREDEAARRLPPVAALLSMSRSLRNFVPLVLIAVITRPSELSVLFGFGAIAIAFSLIEGVGSWLRFRY